MEDPSGIISLQVFLKAREKMKIARERQDGTWQSTNVPFT